MVVFVTIRFNYMIGYITIIDIFVVVFMTIYLYDNVLQKDN